MIDIFLNKLENDGWAELFFLVAGSLLLYCFQRIRGGIRRSRARKQLRANLQAYRERKAVINVVDIANGDPDFAKSNIFLREVSNLGRPKGLFIDMPDEPYSQLLAKERAAGYSERQLTRFHPNESFSGASGSDCESVFSELAHSTGIPDLAQRIGTHRTLVARQLLDRSHGLLFNGRKYGVFDFRHMRFGPDEEPGIEMDLFQTDYFTHRVFRSIYHELGREGHEICRLQAWHDDFFKYRPFFTSFGINALLICEGPESKEIVLSKRSARVHGGKSRYHVTMNEGLSQTDKDAFGRVDLELCFKRGLLEELGIDNNRYNMALRTAFYDFFLDKANLEIGLSAVFETDVNFTTVIESLPARDKSYESDGFVPIPLRAKPICDFISRNEFVPHGLYVLEHVLMRNGVLINKIGQTGR